MSMDYDDIVSASECLTDGASSTFYKELNSRKDMGEDPDLNHNNGLMWCRECPKCRQSVGVTFPNAMTHVSYDDSGAYDHFVLTYPQEYWLAHCTVCESKTQWTNWFAADLAKVPDQDMFEEGDTVVARVRRKGLGRRRIFDLYKFTAKSGTDGILRWCRGKFALVEKVGDSYLGCVQAARQLGLVLFKTELKHRHVAKSKQSIAAEALSNL